MSQSTALPSPDRNAEFNDGQLVSPPEYLEEAVGFMINLTAPWRMGGGARKPWAVSFVLLFFAAEAPGSGTPVFLGENCGRFFFWPPGMGNLFFGGHSVSSCLVSFCEQARERGICM